MTNPDHASEQSPNSTTLEWHPLPSGFLQRITGIHLGPIQGIPNSNTRGFRNVASVNIQEAGLMVKFGQTSQGGIWTSAQPHQGFGIELATNDEGGTTWLPSLAADGAIDVAVERGRLGELPPRDLSLPGKNLGKPGLLSGIVRVTSPANSIAYYEVSADFRGRQDNWHVLGNIVEVGLQTVIDA